MVVLRDPTVTEERYNKVIEKLSSDIDFRIKLSQEKNYLIF